VHQTVDLLEALNVGAREGPFTPSLASKDTILHSHDSASAIMVTRAVATRGPERMLPISTTTTQQLQALPPQQSSPERCSACGAQWSEVRSSAEYILLLLAI